MADGFSGSVITSRLWLDFFERCLMLFDLSGNVRHLLLDCLGFVMEFIGLVDQERELLTR